MAISFPFRSPVWATLLVGAAAGAVLSCTAKEAEPAPDAPPGMVHIAGSDQLPAFFMDATELTTADFATFIEATRYITEAEEFGWSGVFNLDSLAWLPVDGSDWRRPRGPADSAARATDPVTQVSLRDAKAYASWAGKRLPSEEEWVWAASLSGQFAEYPWGEEMVPAGPFPGNWWQGPFPFEDQVLDGFPGIAPVKSFAAAGNGLYDIAGNVWEWTSSTRVETEESVIKGGSFLCSTSYCTGFNFTQRQYTPADSGLNHLGFRCVMAVE